MRRSVTKIAGLKVKQTQTSQLQEHFGSEKVFAPLFFFIQISSIVSDTLLLSSPNPHRRGVRTDGTFMG